ASAATRALSNKQQSLGEQRAAAPGAQRANVLAVGEQLIHLLPGTIAVWNLPCVLAFVQVNRSDPPVRRFEQRQTARSRSAASRRPRVLEIRARGIGLTQLDDDRTGDGREVE